MSSSNFYMAIKSTLDKVMNDKLAEFMATDPDIQGSDLDDVTRAGTVLGSKNSAIVWQLVSLKPEPADPLYIANFYLGAKTSQDSGNYDLTGIVSQMFVMAERGTDYEIRDYSQQRASEIVGQMHVIDSAVVPHQFEHQSGLRLIQVTAKAVSYGH